MANWLITESEHYIFHYKEQSFAHQNIDSIIPLQEQRFSEITYKFPAKIPRKTDYWLCDSREEIAALADDVPTNGLMCWADDDTDAVSIYVVYNKTMQCNGYHEETHAISHFINEPTSSALSEGLACFMEGNWWDIDNNLCTYLYIQNYKYISVERLICDLGTDGDEYFFSLGCEITYPIMGTFVGYLLSIRSAKTFLKLYSYKGNDWKQEIETLYECSFDKLESDFINHINLQTFKKEKIEQASLKLGILNK